MKVEVSVGEVFDKMSILAIKTKKISDSVKLELIRKEFAQLVDKCVHLMDKDPEISETYFKLMEVNETLWDIEDKLRAMEASKDFGPDFIRNARLVYITNDQRFKLKKRINELTGSELMEVKQHPKY